MIEKARIKVLVTGATGYIGSRLVNRLLNSDYDVSITVRPHSDLSCFRGEIEKSNRILIDAETTAVELSELIGDIKPDVVVHLASLYIGEHKVEQIEALINSNVLFGSQLLEAMDCSLCKNLLNVGTAWQHYNNAEYEPVNLYSATKQAFLDIAQYYQKARDFKIIDLKLFDTYGPGDPRQKIIPYLIKNLDSTTEILLSPGDQTINVVHVDDVMDCLEKAIIRLEHEKLLELEEYAVGAVNTLSLKELVSLIERIALKKLPIKWGGRGYRKREVMVPWVTNKSFPGWAPKISLEDGLRQIIQSH